MAPASLVANGGAAGVEAVPGPVTGRFASVYSEVQASRIDHALPLPFVLRKPFKVVDGPASSAAGNPAICTVGAKHSDSGLPEQKLKIGVVLSGGQAPGEHNVISGIFDYLQDRAKGSTMYGSRGGPAGIMKNKYIELTPEYIYPHRNQVSVLSVNDIYYAWLLNVSAGTSAYTQSRWTLEAYSRPSVTFLVVSLTSAFIDHH